jgi:hypothetical protein
MNYELERTQRRKLVTYVKILAQNFPKKTHKTKENMSYHQNK